MFRFKEIMLRGMRSLTAAMLPLSLLTALPAAAEGKPGDVDADGQVTAADVRMLQDHLLGTAALSAPEAADLNGDGEADIYDLAMLKRLVLSPPQEPDPPEEPDPPAPDDNFIGPPVKQVTAYLPSQGTANLVIFYVDFPDCQYDYAPSTEEISAIAFGPENKNSPCYPFDSMTAFYDRSSKGAMQLRGTVFRYTAQNERAYYDTDKYLITSECYNAFNESTDFSQFDGDGDGYIDATLITVPTKAGDDDWWPCAGPFGYDDGFYYDFQVDGKHVGHLITGNAQIESLNDYKNFNSSYLHEMGHCMGLPDYYLYGKDDYEGLHGMAGIEMMDVDASTDFGALSKLQLGWYRESEIRVFDGSESSRSYVLHDAQGSGSNCVVIPCGQLNGWYGEFMIIEYATAHDNNSSPMSWWLPLGEGIRVYHAETTLHDNGYWIDYRYASGSEFTNDDAGRRFIRIIDDNASDTDNNFYHTGDVIDNRISGFNWYDSNANASIDPGVTIQVGAMDGSTCEILISKK